MSSDDGSGYPNMHCHQTGMQYSVYTVIKAFTERERKIMLLLLLILGLLLAMNNIER